MLSNKKSNPIVAEVFIRGRKLNIFLAFITQSSFAVPQKITRISQRYFVIKVSNKEEPEQILFNYKSLRKMHCKSIIFFRLLMLVLHQIIFYDLEKSFTMNIKITMTNDDKD